MSDIVELNDEQLNSVSGGGSGNIPAGGITYSTYQTTLAGHYYAKNINDTEVVWLYIECGWGYAQFETLTINGNTWTSTPHGEPCAPPNPFSQLYPYVLNIRP